MKSCIKLTAWVSRRLVFGHGEDSEPQQKGKLPSNLPPLRGGRPTLQKRKRKEYLPSHTSPAHVTLFLFLLLLIWISFLWWFSDHSHQPLLPHIHPSLPHFVHFTLSFLLYAEHSDTWTIKTTWPADTNPCCSSSAIAHRQVNMLPHLAYEVH